LGVDDQVQFKAVEPAGGGLAARGVVFEDPMAVDPPVVADGQGRGIDDGVPTQGLKQGRQGHDATRHEFHATG
jgi:hypothetical protein